MNKRTVLGTDNAELPMTLRNYWTDVERLKKSRVASPALIGISHA